MIRLQTVLIGQPRTLIDARGTWSSAIFRHAVEGPIELQLRGLSGDQVADIRNHGSRNQAVCCHPIEHYCYWNDFYQLSTPESMLGPGGVGENWTLSGATEQDLCIGDVFSVGTAQVQISAPRFPCTKQERKLQLPGFHQQTIATLRTGLYLRVLKPGTIKAGDELRLEERPQPGLTVHAVNVQIHHSLDPDLGAQLLEIPELASGWKRIVRMKLNNVV